MRLLSRLVAALPIGFVLFLGNLLGAFWYYVLPIRRDVALRNVDRVFRDRLPAAERRTIVRRCFTHQVLYALDVLRSINLTAAEAERRVQRQGFERVEQALAAGKGCILICAHVDSLDLCGGSLAIRGVRLASVVKELSWKPANELIMSSRRRAGIELLQGAKVWTQIVQALADNKPVALIVDQHMPSHRGIVCSFFGQLASTTPAPVRLAMETGAPIIPMVIQRVGLTDLHVQRFEEELVLESPFPDVDTNVWHNTERINRIVEKWVLETPDQWLWLHKRWKVQDAPQNWKIPDSLKPLIG